MGDSCGREAAYVGGWVGGRAGVSVGDQGVSRWGGGWMGYKCLGWWLRGSVMREGVRRSVGVCIRGHGRWVDGCVARWGGGGGIERLCSSGTTAAKPAGPI